MKCMYIQESLHMQLHGVGGRRRGRNYRADLQCHLTAPDQETEQVWLAPRLLPSRVWCHKLRAVPHGPEKLCPQLCRLLSHLLLYQSQRQVGVSLSTAYGVHCIVGTHHVSLDIACKAPIMFVCYIILNKAIAAPETTENYFLTWACIIYVLAI